MGVMDEACALLRQMLGPDAEFRPGQYEAIAEIVERRRRALVVQHTGWGKSVVYSLATKLLRAGGAGPTLLISPLLSLMRNQITMAESIGIRAASINSDNGADWSEIEKQLESDEVDVLLVSPERLANDRFLNTVLPAIRGRVGLFVVDEAHCISDWGHDFRPDYRRIVRIVRALPASVPVLATTATANDRVIADVQEQIGQNLLVLRGPLARTTLRLQCLTLEDQSARLAWLATWLPRLPGSGIVYCLTVANAERVAEWLQIREIDAHPYHADLPSERKVTLEEDLIANRVKALVATVALGMGFNKPDLGFVVHYQRPSSVVAYYQQVGRAGRAIDRAYGILLSGDGDDEIADFFIRTAFPDPALMRQVVNLLDRSDGLSLRQLQQSINANQSNIARALKLLELDGAVAREGNLHIRTPNAWRPDTEHYARVTAQRRAELEQIREYVGHPGCLMRFLAQALDDPAADRCSICANCRGAGIPPQVDHRLIAEAVTFLQGAFLNIEPRQVWPVGAPPDCKGRIDPAVRAEIGRALSIYGDAGWGRRVEAGKYVEGHFADDLVVAAADLIASWRPDPAPIWVAAIPSLRHPNLVSSFALRLADRLGLPLVHVLVRTADTPEQKTMLNGAHQACNAARAFAIAPDVSMPAGPVLLVDDVVDSRWTLTCAAILLRLAGSGPVYPFALAKATSKDA